MKYERYKICTIKDKKKNVQQFTKKTNSLKKMFINYMVKRKKNADVKFLKNYVQLVILILIHFQFPSKKNKKRF